MRLLATFLLAGLTSAFIVPLEGCSETEDINGVSLRSRRASSSTPPADGASEEHDVNDTEGATAPPGAVNPNGTTKPAAPTTAGTPSYAFALTLSENTPTMGLGEQRSIDVTVEPKNGFNAPVDVTVTGLPDGATAQPLTLTPGAPGKLLIKTALTTVVTPADGSSALVVTGKSGEIQATANANFKVAPKVTLTVPMNVDALRAAAITYRDEYGDAFGSNAQPLRTQQDNGIVVTVFNADSKAHIIHGSNGFAHGDTNNPIQPNAFEIQNGKPRERVFQPGANANGYLHDGGNGQGASFRIKVTAAP